ncbi:MAG: extracellular solute-binding protein, partial [Pseudomonadota bacterium]
MSVTRRRFGQLSAGALLLGGLGLRADLSLAANPRGVALHGISAFGELKYAPDFTHFGYVNPDAPKGGEMNFSVPNWAFNQNPQTFNTLNTFVQKGDAPPRMELCYDALMFAVSDEPSSLYGMLAETVTISEDGNTFTFAMRPEARWHDGTPITADDAAWTLMTFKADGHPSLLLALTEMASAEAPDSSTLIVTFTGRQSAQAVLTLAAMPILSKTWHEANPFADATMERPLTSGAYKPGLVNPGQSIVYERVEDYWARDLPFAQGRNNFDRIRIDFYRERQAAFEAFKKGDITYRQEFTSKAWATEYGFPAVEEGKVVVTTFDAETVPSMQAWALNTRRDKLSDPRTREAIGLAFDFDWTNDNLFYGAYARADSV